MKVDVSYNDTIANIVHHGAEALGIHLPPNAADAFVSYYSFLEKNSRHMNLTAIKNAEDVARLHYLDSIALLGAAEFGNARVIDIGSGAGFPGLALKIADPTIDLTMLEATGKRVSFLSNLCAFLEIDASCIHARAEEAAHFPEMREKYDIAVSRAVARLNVLCELSLPFVRVGGILLAMKSVDSKDEVCEAVGAVSTLGATLREIFDYTIPDTDITHRVILIRKTSMTPNNYPRRFAKIQKAPL